ncbi:MAG: arsenosugar biosynthesis radical SAM protein ArsS [Gammaproteobacteria bacterium]|nr:arsenosugar biosynthesis radical SAM protein ArsS [Gammaproteobacteria bacterium]
MHSTLPLLAPSGFPELRRARLTTLQVNLGYRCNQSCIHCHVNAGPTRTEMMSAETLALVLQVLTHCELGTLDLTGGAPELHPGFRELVAAARALGVRVIDRCNLTVLLEPGQEELAEFLAAQGVEIVASLPCYSVDNVDRQRGSGVFEKSIAALRRLNALGYGRKDSGLVLTLVYNPQGPVLPPPQAQLQAEYRRELGSKFGIEFNALFALTNMPIQRFGSTLISKRQFGNYLALLKAHHQDEHMQHVMCRQLVSVDWQGRLYDCDFNQQLGLGIDSWACMTQSSLRALHLRDLLDTNPAGASIRVGEHCYGCTAGSGSSCGGALGAPGS